MTARIDHLVVAAATLDDGVAWCEATLGVTPEAGGVHPLMGTHNRLLKIGTHAYLEVIAINPAATPERAPPLHRWYDLDDPMLRETVKRKGPHLIHFVADVPKASASLHALEKLGLERGPLLEASRMTPIGLLQWRITVRDDGQRLFWGMLPTLIEWGDVHPSHSLPDSGITLTALHASHPRPEPLEAAWRAIGLTTGKDADGTTLAIHAGAPNLSALLQTPRGPVTLHSEGT